MPSITDQEYLFTQQYKDPTNLTARGSLHERFSTNPTGWFKWVFDQLENLPECANILELGSGPAWIWASNRSRIPADWTIVLTDLSPGMVEQARRNLGPDVDPRVQFDIVDALAMPYADATFDAVMANHMLYHVPDRPRAFAEIHRVLRPGGRLFAATNGREHMAELWTMVLEATDGSPARNRSDLHFGLENGGEQLAPWFSRVERRLYPDSLLVAEADPLIAYATSSALWGTQGDDAATERLAARIRRQLAEDGVIRISKSSGMFIAQA